MTTYITSSTTLSQQPYINTGVIYSFWDNGTVAQGTFSLVGVNDILTATHVVYDPNAGGFADSFEFYFGANYDNFGDELLSYEYSLTDNFAWEINAWPDQTFADNDHDTLWSEETAYDIAIIGISVPVGDDLGWLGLSSAYNYDTYVTSLGYPDNTVGLVSDQFTVQYDGYYGTYYTEFDVQGPGSSGGPLLVGDTVIGVKSAGGGGYSAWADIGNVWEQLKDIMEENNSLLEDYNSGHLNNPLYEDSDDAGDSFATAQVVDASTGDGDSFSIIIVEDMLGTQDEYDYFTFTAPYDGELVVSLLDLEADLDLTLWQGTNTILDESFLYGNEDETVTTSIEEGQQYYIEVYPYETDYTEYQLSLSIERTISPWEGGQGITYLGTDAIDLITYNQTLVEQVGISPASTIFDSTWVVQLADWSTDTLVDVERLVFDDYKVALDLTPTSAAGSALALLYSAIGQIPDPAMMSLWISHADNLQQTVASDSLVSELAEDMLDTYLPDGISNAALVSHLFQQLVGIAPTEEQLNGLTDYIDSGEYTQAEFFAAAAQLDLNIDHYAPLVSEGLLYL